jgi:hypothetical protein
LVTNNAINGGVRTIAGTTGSTTSQTVTGAAVLCAADGQLGTVVSSKRYKENVKDLEPYDDKLLNLRPVSFNYKKDEAKLPQMGLIAEEVHDTLPYLCLYNSEGEPEIVKYHELPVLLLQTIQKLTKRIEALEAKVFHGHK